MAGTPQNQVQQQQFFPAPQHQTGVGGQQQQGPFLHHTQQFLQQTAQHQQPNQHTQQYPMNHPTVNEQQAMFQQPHIQQTANQYQYQQPGYWQAPPVQQNPAVNLSVIRACLTNLSHLSDEDMMQTDFSILVQLNKAAKQQPAQDMQAVAAQAFAAAAAAHMTPQHHSLPDPGVKMAKALEQLRANPTEVPAGLDDRSSVLHVARFLGGMTCSALKKWAIAREIIPLEGLLPLSNYDMAAAGLGGCVTPRGWLELHNPASTHLTIKLFSASNLGTSTGNTRRLTLAGDEDGISIGEHLKEVEDIDELQQAMLVLCYAAHLVMPWNQSFDAIQGFLRSSKWCQDDLLGNPRRAATITKFINHVIQLNAEAWQLKNPFLMPGEVKTRWTEWLSTRPASDYKPATTATAAASAAQSYVTQPQAGGGQSRAARRKAARQNYQQQQQIVLPNMSTPPPNQQRQQNQQGGQRGGRPNPAPKLCRKYNTGTCLNIAGNCSLPSGTPLLHLCDFKKPNNEFCMSQHVRVHFH
jgi:hypothetical protein